MNYMEKLVTLKEELETAKEARTKAMGTMETLVKQEEELVKEIKSMGIDPNNLDEEIIKIKKEIDELFNEAETILGKKQEDK